MSDYTDSELFEQRSSIVFACRILAIIFTFSLLHIICTVPPTSVEIVDYVAGSRIMSREGEELLLQCLVRNAKPAAEIVWFKRNVEIKSGECNNNNNNKNNNLPSPSLIHYRCLRFANNETSSFLVAPLVDRIENITTDAEMPRRFDTRSKLTIRAQPDDNDAEYTCEARHPALIAPKRATVALNIQCKDLALFSHSCIQFLRTITTTKKLKNYADPPGPPEIIGYTEGETVRTGQEVKLECISRGGNPLAQIVWYKNEVKIDHTYETTGRESRNVYIFRADASDNNARFRCEASNLLSPNPMKAEITLTVHCKSILLALVTHILFFFFFKEEIGNT